MSDQDPAVGTWQEAVERSYAESTHSTSAHARQLEEQLDQVRRDYNAELAARVAAERERDEARAACADVEKYRKIGSLRLIDAERERDEFVAAADKLHGEWLDLKTELHAARHDAEHCAAERDRALAQVERWRRTGHDVIAQSGWIVARVGGRDCERCDHEIRRGEAYQYLGADRLEHIHCPDKGATDG